MRKKTAGRAVFVIALIVAVLCIALGIYGVWRSFERFDDSILTEKDTQLYSLMRSGDISLENSINAIQREAEIFLGREKLKSEIAYWKESGKKESLKNYISNNTLVTNPIYADLVMNHNGKIVCSASGNKSYSPVTGSDSNGISLWKDSSNVYYMAWHQEAAGDITYDILIDLSRLYSMAIGTSNDREIMLLDAASVLALTSGPDGPVIRETGAEADERFSNFRDFMMSRQKEMEQRYQTVQDALDRLDQMELSGPDEEHYVRTLETILENIGADPAEEAE